MTAPRMLTALCAALPLPPAEPDAAPRYIHLLPAGEVTTMDGRGPYRVPSAAALIAASLAVGDRLPIDENHSTDIAAPKGAPSPAQGWIIGLQARSDGIWGEVEWNAAGRGLVAEKAYRHISPVIAHRPDGTVTGILRASLVNRPNLRGLTALHQQEAPVIVNGPNLKTLYTGFSNAFQAGFKGADPLYKRAAMVVKSSSKSTEYGWLGQFPRMREWIGDRVVQNLTTEAYTIVNRSFESTIAVSRDDIEDDHLGIYDPIFAEFGRQSATFPDELVWALLKAGWTTNCFDGQNFFDVDHPVKDALGRTVSVANTDGGTGHPWFLIDDTRVIRPLIYQERRAFDLVRMDSEDDEQAFSRKEYRYGTEGRCNVGFGFWQLAWGSKQALDAAHYEAARVGIASMKSDFGRPLGLQGKLLIVGPALEAAGRKLLNNEFAASGETNSWKGSAELVVVPWLD